ncbi:MAG: hypothetical protein ACQESP_10480 [Candidatus Muiribacteriota bacterium]
MKILNILSFRTVIFLFIVCQVFLSISVYSSSEIGRSTYIYKYPDDKEVPYTRPEFPYQLIEVVQKSEGEYEARLYSEIEEKNITVNVGDKVRGFNFTTVERKQLNEEGESSFKNQVESTYQEKLKEFSQQNNFKKPSFEDLNLGSIFSEIELDEEELGELEKVIEITQITPQQVVLFDTLRQHKFILSNREFFEEKFKLKTNLNPVDLNIQKTQERIIVDANRDDIYPELVSSEDFNITGAFDDKYFYLYIEHIIAEPVMKSSEAYLLRASEGLIYYDTYRPDDFLHLIFTLSEESALTDFVRRNKTEVNVDVWDWKYIYKYNKFLNDMFGVFSQRKTDKGSHYVEYPVISDDGRDKFLYLTDDEGFESFFDTTIYSPTNFTGNYFIPQVLAPSPGLSKEDVIIALDFEEANKQSLFISGKIKIELKRPLNTGFGDDIQIRPGSSYILVPSNRKQKEDHNVLFDLEKSIRLNF